jgi:ATP-dependent Lhr-like helicase
VRLEADGVVLRGRFSPGESDLEWCDRTLLARIHRYTLNRLRAEIEPVSPADFMRFLFRWQHVDTSSRLEGLDGLRTVIGRLAGYELPASTWERAVLPARIDGYDPSMLDMMCLAGEAGWGRLSRGPAQRSPASTFIPGTPIALFAREHAQLWRRLRPDGPEPVLGETASLVLSVLRSGGASFFGDLKAASGLDADQLQHALGALVACGIAASDGFSGLRAIVRAARGRPPVPNRRSNFAGRWTAIVETSGGVTRDDAVELQAWTLLGRYGVVFRRLLARETNAATWRELTQVYRRLEARGELRGGRFVSGMSGEQFALPDAVERLREVRRIPGDGELVTISAADPLNLTGAVTTGERIRTAGRNRIAYRAGVPVAVLEGGAMRELTAMDPSAASTVSRALKARGTHVLANVARMSSAGATLKG